MASEKNLARARRGAVWLDRKLGRGWRRKIRRRELDMGNGGYMPGVTCGCIIAQIDSDLRGGSGNYAYGLMHLGVSAPVQLGFAADGRVGNVTREYDDLTEAWRVVLREPGS